MAIKILLPMLALFTLGFTPADTEPKLIHRDKQPYVAIRATITLQNYSRIAPPLWGEVAKWLKSKGMKPAGPPIARYLIVDMEKGMQIDIGFPVAKPIKGNARILSDFLPEGRYVQVVHKGDYSGMVPANGALQDWAKKQNLEWKMSGNKWGGRVEFNRIDPADTPDSSQWETEILYQVK